MIYIYCFPTAWIHPAGSRVVRPDEHVCAGLHDLRVHAIPSQLCLDSHRQQPSPAGTAGSGLLSCVHHGTLSPSFMPALQKAQPQNLSYQLNGTLLTRSPWEATAHVVTAKINSIVCFQMGDL